MFQNGKVLLPTDFSHYALYAMKYAIAIAQRYDGEVHFAHVLSPTVTSAGSSLGLWVTRTDMDKFAARLRENAERRLTHLARIASDAGVPSGYHIIQGSPALVLPELAHRLQCDLIVAATHGRTGLEHVVYGSVCEKMIRQAHVPVLCVKHPEHEFVKEDDGEFAFDLKRVLFPTDFSDVAQHAVPYAVSICKQFGAQLVLFHAEEVLPVSPDYMPDRIAASVEELSERSREGLELMQEKLDGVEVEIVTAAGSPDRQIAQLTQESHIDLIVMPTHGRSGVAHVLFGSVAEKVLRLARCPVLIVRHGVEVESVT